MNSNIASRFFGLVAFGMMLSTASIAQETRKIADNINVQAGGCQDVSIPYRIEIPNFEKLDKNYNGVVTGIEFVVRTNNNGGHRDVRFDGNHLVFTIFAKGGGSIQHYPCPIIPQDPGRMCPTCVTPSGASYAIDIIAHYNK